MSDGTSYAEDLTNCDGASATAISNMYCDIPMATLRTIPYSLT